MFGIRKRVFLADWQRHGRRAGFIRNQRMLDEGRPDLVIAFPAVVAPQTWWDARGALGVEGPHHSATRDERVTRDVRAGRLPVSGL